MHMETLSESVRRHVLTPAVGLNRDAQGQSQCRVGGASRSCGRAVADAGPERKVRRLRREQHAGGGRLSVPEDCN